MTKMNFQANKSYLSSSIAGIVCAALVFIFYIPLLDFEFVNWDDDVKVYNNIYIQKLDWAFVQWAFTEVYQASYHPLTWFSHALDYRLWGLNPLGHHLTNLVLHCLNVYLVFSFTAHLQLMVKLRQSTAGNDLANAPLLPLVAALLFGLHPTQVEAVAWVTARKDVLYTAFSLLSLIAYCRYVNMSQVRPAIFRLPFILSVFCFLCAVISKPAAIVLPVLFLVLDCYPGGRLRGRRLVVSLLLEKIPLLLIGAWITYMTIYAHLSSQQVLSGFDDVALPQRLFNACYFVSSYLQNVFLPINLTPFHPFSRTVHLTMGETFVAVMTVILITVLAIWCLRRATGFMMLWLFFLVGLLPTLGLVQAGQQLYADRYAYMANYAVYLLVAIAMLKVWQICSFRESAPYRIAYSFVIGILLALLLWQTQMQLRVWENGLSLWANVVDQKPQEVGPYKNYGNSLLMAGQYHEAAKSYMAGLELMPGEPDLLNNLAVAWLDLEDYKKAEGIAKHALRIYPSSARALNTLGEIMLHKGSYDESLQYFHRAIQREGLTYITAFNMSLVYEKLNDISNACRYLRQYVQISPSPEDGQEKLMTLACEKY